jgi:CBS domain-containing protein
MITTETARDIMETHPIFATEEEGVEAVLRRMIEKNVKEIAVLDSQKRPVADLTMIDLLRFLIQTGKTIP